jgi:branched-chain amino acid transport system permease protein
VFAVVLAGIAINQPAAFGGYVIAVALGVVALGRLGVIGALRDVTRGPLGRAISFALILAFPFTQLTNPLWIRVAGLGAIFAALALGLNIVVGRAGLLDLGYAAFFGIGAFSGALLSDCTRCPMQHHLPWLLALLISGLFGAVFGVLLGTPVLRLRGDYLAIVTLGFGEIVRIALNNLDDVPILHTNLTNGPNGLFGVGHPRIGPVDLGSPITVFGTEVPNVIKYYFVALALMLVIVFVVKRMDSSRIGRAWTAVREDEQAAQAMGINTTRAKLLAFATGAFFGGVAGNIFVHFQTGTSPDDFSFIISVTVLAMVVLGGMGNATGVAIGAVLLIALPEKLRFVSDYRFLIFGAILMVMMRFRPEGLIPEQRRRRELTQQPETPV